MRARWWVLLSLYVAVQIVAAVVLLRIVADFGASTILWLATVAVAALVALVAIARERRAR